MAEYTAQQGHGYAPRSSSIGNNPNHQRDAAFHNIFGGAPPPGRSQTLTSEPTSMPQDRGYQNMPQQVQGMPPQGSIPSRQVENGYDRGYRDVNSGPPQQHMNGYPPRQMSGAAPGYPGQPLPSFPDRRPYPQPQRIDSRPGGPMPSYVNKPIPHRVPAPALNSDAYRSRSMARLGGPSLYGPVSNSVQQGSASSIRQQPYNAGGTRATSQGQQTPEGLDGRSMTMSYLSERDQSQGAPGRHATGSRRESDAESYDIGSSTTSPNSFRTTSTPTVTSPTSHSRKPSDGMIPTRNVSSTSTSTTLVNEGADGAHSRTQSLQHTPSSATTMTMASRRTPMVYPALLSRVADVFQANIGVGDKTKNDLAYKNAFNGSEAVDLIAYIIRTTDRNLALLLGRALDAQKFFHDVTYDHRLRDAAQEVYQFRETMGEEATAKEVNGVFTLLTECYSPTCTRDQLCYSIACPRRLEQQKRGLRGLEQDLNHKLSKGSLHDDEDSEQKLWINSVPKEVAARTDDREKKRQEVISEIMYTERDFVKDLEYLRDFWMRPLRAANAAQSSPIPEHRREKFIRTVFSNCLEILAVNSKFAEALSARQREDPVVSNVGDIFLQYVPRFDPFIKYGANQMYGKFEFEKEKSQNLAFSKFVDETERMKESRKLELNGYLTKPTTRLARYPLLLDNVLKYTKEDSPDMRDIPVAISLIKDFLSRVNAESGKAENHFNLLTLNGQLKFNPGDYVDLKLTEENRQILTKMIFKKGAGDATEITAYLFDHAVLLVRIKTVSKREEYRVYKKPIPLELLVIAEMDQIIPRLGIAKRPSSNLIPGAKALTSTQQADKQAFPVTFKHLGKGGYDLPLYASSSVQRKKFIEKVEEQQSKLRERNSNFYTKTILCEGVFNAANRVNCVVPIDGGRKLAYGTDNGIYLSDRWPKEKSARPKRILDASQVTQIDTLEEYQLLLVLSNKTLTSYPLEALDVNDQNPLAKRPRKIQGHANFFKAGIGLGRHLVCSVKTSALSTTIKVYEPTEHLAKGKKKPAISKMFQGGQDALKPFKEFYIPAESSSVHYLRSTLCVGCAKGFEVVSLETTERQSLLDQADTSLDFVARRENVRPIHIERLNGEFLLNYSDFSFFVNRNGWRARPDWKILWEGTPQAFALNYPYILAFEPSFIEIRHIETSELIHVMTGKNIRMLHSSTREVIPPISQAPRLELSFLRAPPEGRSDEHTDQTSDQDLLTPLKPQILYAYEDDAGEDVIASLDFWSKQS